MHNVGENLDKYGYVYVFGYDNLRAKVLKDLRAALKDDRCVWCFRICYGIAVDVSGQDVFGKE